MKTKLNLKILLLVSILLITMCLFNTNMVQATEVKTDETTDQSNQLPTNGMGAELFNAITKEKFDSIVPNTINVTKTKTDFVNAIIENEKNENSDIFVKTVEEINAEVQTKIITLFENSGYMDTEEVEKETIKAEMQDPLFDFNTITISLTIDGTIKSSKNVTINYAKESSYSATDETYVKNAVKNIKFAQYKDVGTETTDAVFTIYNIGDEENANKWTEKTYDFTKLLNDNSITIKTSMYAGGFGGGTPWGMPMLLHFYKNGVLYETKSIWNLGAYGTTLENGTPVNMAKLEKDDQIYKEMAKELEKDGLKNIIGCYELTAYGTTDKDMKVSFNVGTNYNGKEVKILHKKSDNTYETFTAKVENGKVTITVNEFSPFMIALKDTKTDNKANDRVLDNEPKTGVVNYTVFASVIAIISLGGLAIIKFKK